jgi:very-short-patch-repair endonuclease
MFDPSPPAGRLAGEAGRVGQGMRKDCQPVLLARRLRRAMTPQEVKLWNWLREGPGLQGFHFRRQAPIGRYIVDFACLKAKLVIEVDGSQPGEAEGAKRDAVRDQALAANGVRVVRFWNHEIDRETTVVMDTIFAALRGDVPPSVSLRSLPPPLVGEDQRQQ